MKKLALNDFQTSTNPVKTRKFDKVVDLGQNRRTFLKTTVLSGVGVIGATATELLFGRVGLAQVNRQRGWRWCRKCQTLTFAGGDSLGACSAGGVHDHQGSGNYVLIQNSPNVQGQKDWRWCNKCQSLTFAGGGSLGRCAAGGVHNNQGSGNYVLRGNDPTYAGQRNWRWCNKCQALTYAGADSLGACPAGGIHNHTGSANYTLQEL